MLLSLVFLINFFLDSGFGKIEIPQIYLPQGHRCLQTPISRFFLLQETGW